MALLGYQQRWCADKNQVKLIEKSRRIGMSWSEAADASLLAASAGGMNCFYTGYTKDMAKEFIDDCADFARVYSLAAGEISEAEEVWLENSERKSITVYSLRFASGWRIEALSSSPRNFRGKQGRIILDEAAFHNDLAELLKAAMAMLIWGGEVHIISTHNGAENPFNELVQDIRAGKLPYSLHHVTFADAIADGLYERVCLRTGKTPSESGKAEWIAGIRDRYGDNAAEELDVVPKNSGGAWLSRALIEARMVPGQVLRWNPPQDIPGIGPFTLWPDEMRTAEMRDWLETNLLPLLAALDPELSSGFGEDFGRTGDLTVIAPYQLTHDMVRRFPFLVELAQCPFDQQRECLFYIGDRLPRLRAGKLDARGNGQYLAEKAIQKWGAERIECVMLSLGWYRDNTAPLLAAFQDGTISLPRSADVVDDLRAFQVVNGIPQIPATRTQGEDGQQRHGDAGVAILLAHAASRSEVLCATEGFRAISRASLPGTLGGASRRML